MAVDARWAFEQYEAVRSALPDAAFGRKPERIDRLESVIDRFDLWLLDAFGVLNLGDTAIPGAVEFIKALRAQGKRITVLSNSASVPSSQTAEKFHRLGFDFSLGEIITSRDALKATLTAIQPLPWGVMATRQSQIEELGVEAVLLEDDPKDYASVGGFILLGSADWTNERQRLLIAATRDHLRPVLVGNPDIVAPREVGLTYEPGFYAHDLARHTACSPQFFGKPFGNVFDLVSERIGEVDPARTVMVGDTLHTDVLGGAAFGVKTVLLTDYGLFAEEAVDPLIASSEIIPDVIARKL